MSKTCTKCGETKTLEEFYFNGHPRKDGTKSRMARCKSCFGSRKRNGAKDNEYSRKYQQKRRLEDPEGFRARDRKWRLGKGRFKQALIASRAAAKRNGHTSCNATVGELEAAWTGKCGICGVPELECTKRLHLDHCHDAGCFRDWICSNCNTGLGHFKDSEELLVNALHHLMNSNKKVNNDGHFC